MLSSSERWNPVFGPVPGPGLTVAYPFFIDAGGNYSFELAIPSPPRKTVAMPELPPVKASLDLTITGPNHFSMTNHIAALRQGSEYPFGHLVYYQSGRFDLSGRGDYVITVVADAEPQSWSSSGAMWSLKLNENPTNAVVGAQLGRMLGLVVLALGVLGHIIYATKVA